MTVYTSYIPKPRVSSSDDESVSKQSEITGSQTSERSFPGVFTPQRPLCLVLGHGESATFGNGLEHGRYRQGFRRRGPGKEQR